eukprot:2342331-Alexandrium_andersonii.AAC.1
MCAKLRRSLYGARAAPARWGACAEILESFGFAKGRASACCYYNAELGVRCVVHGGDFAFTGYDADLDVVEKLMDEKFVVQHRGASRRRPVGPAGSEAAEPHHQVDARRAPV